MLPLLIIILGDSRRIEPYEAANCIHIHQLFCSMIILG